jgi:endonuclease V-like protein UPF0215 family
VTSPSLSPSLARALARARTLRVAGFDDAPFRRVRGATVPLCGVICAGTRFEGMLWGHTRRDGWKSTDAIAAMLLGSKFLPQLHLVLLDGIAFGGFNIVDLPALSERVGLPCAAIMRRPPDLPSVHAALQCLSNPPRRLALLARAGDIHHRPPFTFQVAGAPPELIEQALPLLTDQGHVPEALRLAHLVGSAVCLGQSGRRA